jgi:hypothetical protein
VSQPVRERDEVEVIAGGAAQQAQSRLDPGDLHEGGYPDRAVAEGDLLDLDGAGGG